MTFDADMDEDRDRHVVAGDAERLEIGHCLVERATGQVR